MQHTNTPHQYVHASQLPTLAAMLIACAAWLASVPGLHAQTGGLQFDGVNDYVTFGAATNLNNLGVTNFTVECWFKRTGAGAITTTGTLGVTNAIPLVSKGRGEAENSNLDMNWFLGFTPNGILAADFEDRNGGTNHPITGATAAASNVWQHAAITYYQPSGTWVLYLNGQPDKTNVVAGADNVRTPRFDSIQHAGLGSAMNSTGVAAGFFAGILDEVRIWNVARTSNEISASYSAPMTTNTPGLIARWGLDEISGTNIFNLVPGGVSGVLKNGVLITNGYFVPPTVSLTNPANNATISATSLLVEATAADADGTVAKVEFLANTTLLGQATTAPYNFTWSSTNLGAYALRAVATDNHGLVTTSAVVNVTVTPPTGTGALYFDGVNDYVTFGAAPSLGVSNFTVECWFKQQGPGKRANTGSGGIRALPLVTKGMAENENGPIDCNWFFGVGTNLAGSNVLAADFEDYNNGLNHPVLGNTPVGSNVWVHGAVTYSVAGSNWVLYLNGVADTNLVISGPAGITNLNMLLPRFDSIQHAALGASLRTNGVTNADSGFFAGTLDEVRIWNTVRSSNEIADNYQVQIPSATGLIARWALDDATGFAATNSGSSGVTGTLTNGPVWVDGYTFATPPAPPAINDDPDSTNVNCGDNVTFNVTATGAGTLAYQWYFQNAPLTGETNSALPLSNVDGTDVGSYLVTVQNAGGSVTSSPASLTITDTTAPIITVCATNITLSTDTNCQATIPDLTPQIVAADTCSAVTLTQSPLAGTLVGLGNTLVTLTATDASSNAATCNATVTVVDATAPVITVCATNITLSTDTNCQATIPDLTPQVVAADTCSAVTLTQSPLAGTIIDLGNTLVTLTATDASSNAATCNATVTVVDATAPIITVCATNITLSADTNCQAAIPDLTPQVVAADTCSAVILTQSPLAGTLVGLGNTLVTLTATDASSNAATCNATVTVVDATAPIITVCATNITLSADTNCQAAIPDLTPQVVAADTCSAVILTQSPLAGTLVGLGNTLVTLTATDASSNAATCNATVTVVDATAPIITVCATNITLSTDTNCQATIPDLTPQVVAADTCSAVIFTQSPLAGTLVGLGNTLVTLTATDASSNAATCNATVTVVDVTTPIISVCATNITLSTDTNCQATIPDLTPQVVAADTCSAVTLTQSPLAGTLVGLGNTLVTLTATDASSNAVTCNATVTVVDAQAPVITLEPQSLTNLIGSTAGFTLTATSCSALSYQWMFSTNVLAGATNATITLTNVQLTSAGDYLAIVANTAGNTTSAVAVLTVLLPAAPVLSASPVILPNGSFSAGFTGSPGVPYTILCTTNLMGTWETLTNLTADGVGFLGLEDATTPAPPQRFYRVVYP